MSNNAKRIISGVVGALILLIVLVFEKYAFYPAAAILMVYMIFEALHAFASPASYIICGMLFGTAYALSLRFLPVLPIIAFLCFAYVVAVSLITLKNCEKLHFNTISIQCFTTFYISFCFGTLILIQSFESAHMFLLILVFACAWLSDIGAYTFGKLFGKKKLIESVSPKKTVAGAIGGIISAAAGCLIIGIIAKTFYRCEVNYALIFAVGALTAAAGQIGDLIASMMKRFFAIKDFGKIMPGHGGALDRFDSVMLTSPCIYFACVLLSYAGLYLIK